MRSAGVRAPPWADPDARNLREKWLPAIEWYYSERVKRACKARDRWKTYSKKEDEELLERCDFAIFIDLTAMCQHPSPPAVMRSEVEQRLFKHALANLVPRAARTRAARRAPPRPPAEAHARARPARPRRRTSFTRTAAP